MNGIGFAVFGNEATARSCSAPTTGAAMWLRILSEPRLVPAPSKNLRRDVDSAGFIMSFP
jgi:hypothetical protein